MPAAFPRGGERLAAKLTFDAHQHDLTRLWLLQVLEEDAGLRGGWRGARDSLR